MAGEDTYRQLGDEFLTRARGIASPKLKDIYLRLAVAYDDLARFHERVQPHRELADSASAQVASEAPTDDQTGPSG